MATASDVLKAARAEIGYKESPAGSNHTKYGVWYGLDHEPWCAIWVSFVFNKVGALDLVGGKFAYCPYWVDHFKKKGQWLDRSEKPRPGDLVFFSNGKRVCHVGIVEERLGTDYVMTIEGNTSASSNDNGGAVMERKRAYGKRGSSWFIMGFSRPDYGSAKPGWVKTAKGWWYRNPDGSYPRNCWRKLGGYWYRFDKNGYMLTGWQKVDDSWYYMDSKGHMLTGWQKISGKWYYFTGGDSGRMRTGWLKDDGRWYYLADNGAMVSSRFERIGGKWYGFASNGAMVTSQSQLQVDSKGAIAIGK